MLIKTPFIIYSNNRLLIIAVCCLLFCGGCKNYTTDDDNPAYFNPVFKKVDAASNENKEQVFVYLDSAFNAFPNAGPGDKFQKYDRKWKYYFSVKNYSKAMFYADSMLLLCKNKTQLQKYAEQYAKAMLLKGDCFIKLKKYDDAFNYYYQGRQAVISKVKDKCSLVGYNGSLGNLYFVQGKYLLAAAAYLDDYNDHLSCTQELPFYRFCCLQGSLNNVALCYLNAGITDSATLYCDSAGNFINTHKNEFPNDSAFIKLAKAVIYANQAYLLSKKQEYSIAEKLYQQSIEGTKTADPQYAQATQVRFATLYFESGRYMQGDTILQQLKLSLDTLPNEAALISWYKLRVDYSTAKSKIDTPYSYLKKYLSIKDSLQVKNDQFTAMDISSEFENREQKAMNEVLQKDSQLKSVYILIAIITSIMALVIILLVWQNLKHSAKHVRELEALNHEVLQKNKDLQKTLNSLDLSHRENTRIMRVVAHDLKNPINTIQHLTHSVLKKEQTPALTEIFELIKSACVDSISLIKDLLGAKKRMAILKEEPVDMGRLLKQCIELLQAKADEKKQQLNVQEVYHPVMMLNRQQIWRVISNIINNAIKFSPGHTEIVIRLEKKDDTVLLSVKDAGIGIPEQLKDKIFSIAPESSRKGTAGEESYGLGMSISQKIIEEHHGKIWFESEHGKGSVFYVELPGG